MRQLGVEYSRATHKTQRDTVKYLGGRHDNGVIYPHGIRQSRTWVALANNDALRVAEIVVVEVLPEGEHPRLERGGLPHRAAPRSVKLPRCRLTLAWPIAPSPPCRRQEDLEDVAWLFARTKALQKGHPAAETGDMGGALDTSVRLIMRALKERLHRLPEGLVQPRGVVLVDVRSIRVGYYSKHHRRAERLKDKEGNARANVPDMCCELRIRARLLAVACPHGGCSCQKHKNSTAFIVNASKMNPRDSFSLFHVLYLETIRYKYSFPFFWH